MSITDNTLFEGSVKIIDGTDTSLYGFADLSIDRNLEVIGTSTLFTTNISTSDGAFTVAGANPFELESIANSKIITQGADLIIATSDSGNLIFNATQILDLNGVQFDIDATSDSTFDVIGDLSITATQILDLNSAQFTLDATSDSTITTTGASLNMTVDNTLDANLGALDLDASSDSFISVSNNNLNLETLTAGNVNVSGADNVVVTAVDILDLNGAQIDIDATSDSTLDVVGDLAITVTEFLDINGRIIDIDATSDSTFDVIGDLGITATQILDLNGAQFTLDATSDSTITTTGASLTMTVDNTLDANLGALDLDASSDSFISVSNNNLNLETLTAGNVNVSGADNVVVTAVDILDLNGAQIDIDATSDSTLDVVGDLSITATQILDLNSAQFTLDATSDSTITATGASLNMTVDNTLDANLGALDLDASSDSFISVSNNNLNLETLTAGNVNISGADNVVLTATDILDMNSAQFTLDASSDSTITTTGASLTMTVDNTLDANVGALDLDASSDSFISVSNNDLNLETLTSGNVKITSANNVELDATGSGIIDLQTLGGAINIGTNTSDVAVTIGANISETTIGDNLTVNGTSTLTGDVTMSGNAVVQGNLTVNGSSVILNTETLLVEDNLIGINNAPSAGGRDCGIHVTRFSTDVVADTATESGTLQSASDSLAELAAGASAADDNYNQWWISITGGTGSGQNRQITDYTGATKLAVISSDWGTQPDNTSTYSLFNKPYTALVYDESADEWALGYTTDDAASTTVSISPNSQYGTLHIGNLIVENAISGGNVFNEALGVVDNANTPTVVTNTDTRGSFMILVQSSDDAGACASFMCSSRGSDVSGQISTTSNSNSSTSERIRARWDAGEKVEIYHSPTKSGGTGANLTYKVTVIKVQ